MDPVTVAQRARANAPGRVAAGERGWTLIELLILVVILGIILAIAAPALLQTLERVRLKRAVADMRMIDFEIGLYRDLVEGLPSSLDDLGPGNRLDPWGRAYVYYPFVGPGWRGGARKDRFLVPINSGYDLYSLGPDRKSRPPLQHPLSLDDIVRANDGQFYGRGRDF
jgi:general secretion pathway protein G